MVPLNDDPVEFNDDPVEFNDDPVALNIFWDYWDLNNDFFGITGIPERLSGIIGVPIMLSLEL